ncbi:MAG: class I SAM-dependent methyltransferase [Candidatus Bathyarchaeia archaeon]
MVPSAQEEEYWNKVAIEAEKEELQKRVEKWHKAAKNWLAHYSDKKTRDFIVQTIKNHVKLKNGARILDVGCGAGKWVNLFAEMGFETVGIDSSPWMIRLAKSRVKTTLQSRIKFYVMNVAELKFPDDSYDMTNCVTVLQHIFDDTRWKRAVYEMVRVTKPCGYILIFEAAPSFILKRRTPRLRFRSMKEYISEFKSAGARLTYWRATDLSFPITFLGLRKYAASFSKRVYYYFAGELPMFPPSFLSALSRAAAILAEPIDYRLSESPLSVLSVGKILLFRKLQYDIRLRKLKTA